MTSTFTTGACACVIINIVARWQATTTSSLTCGLGGHLGTHAMQATFLAEWAVLLGVLSAVLPWDERQRVADCAMFVWY